MNNSDRKDLPIPNALSNARYPGESFADYKARRAVIAREVKKHLKGKLAVIASEPVQLPIIGADSQVDEAVLRGYYKDLRVVTLKNGEQIRIGRTKGKTYWRGKA